jgi:four helix bundle protein
MNTTRTTPLQPPPTGTLTAHRLALQAAHIAIAVARSAPPALRSVAEQLIRAAVSVPANLAEGAGRTGRDRRHHWRIAYGSALEVDTHLRLLAGTCADPSTVEALCLFDRVRAMTWRLLHPRP